MFTVMPRGVPPMCGDGVAAHPVETGSGEGRDRPAIRTLQDRQADGWSATVHGSARSQRSTASRMNSNTAACDNGADFLTLKE
jgi:hypothetical protein